MDPGPPNWRMPAGVGAMVLWIILWAALVIHVVAWMEPLPQGVVAILYGIAGILWIVPLRPLMLWMYRGTPPKPPPH